MAKVRANCGSSSGEFGSMAKVGEDLVRANRSVNAVKGNKGGPGTAQGIHAMANEVEHKGGFLGKLLMHGAPAVAGHLLVRSVNLGARLAGSSVAGADVTSLTSARAKTCNIAAAEVLINFEDGPSLVILMSL